MTTRLDGIIVFDFLTGVVGFGVVGFGKLFLNLLAQVNSLSVFDGLSGLDCVTGIFGLSKLFLNLLAQLDGLSGLDCVTGIDWLALLDDFFI